MQYEDALLKLKRAEQLAEAQLLAQQDVDTARSTARVAETSVTGARAQLTQAEAALTQAKVNLSHTVINAPTDGIVLSRAVEIGQTVSASTQAPTLFIIARDLKRLELQARVDESDVGGVEPGAPVTFTVDAYPRREFTGTVRLVQLQPQTVQNVVTYTTIIDVPNDDGRLKPGMTSTASIQVARAENTLARPGGGGAIHADRASARGVPGCRSHAAEPASVDAARAVWQLVDGRLTRIPVRMGVSDGTQVAITTDRLAEGASIITGIARSDATAAAAPAASGSPLVPQMPRRPGNAGGGARQGRSGS